MHHLHRSHARYARRSRWLFPVLAMVTVCLMTILTLTAAASTDQIPTTFTNLRVLPKDIAPGDLIGVMKQYAITLGVRCQHCHVGEEGADLGTFDFVSDTKTTKSTARRMQQMVNAINGEFLRDIGEPSDQPKVTCFTCHRGASRPPASAGGDGDMK